MQAELLQNVGNPRPLYATVNVAGPVVAVVAEIRINSCPPIKIVVGSCARFRQFACAIGILVDVAVIFAVRVVQLTAPLVKL